MSERLSRRTFLTGAGAVGAVVGGGAVAAGCSLTGATAGDPPDAAGDRSAPVYRPFIGPHQTGITAVPVPALGMLAAFRCVAADRTALTSCLVELTDEIRALMAGEAAEQRDPAYPPADSGVLGHRPPADNLSVVLSVGASLFDDRYGLRERRPRELVEMPFLANDRLDPDRSHGDLLLTLEAEHPDTLLFAVRQLMRRTREWLVLHWMLEGYTRGSSPSAGAGAPRNLLGFKDGTANLDPQQAAVMDRHVWVSDSDVSQRGEPAWAVGGSYQAVRVIRMLVEFWDRTRLSEQEAIMGRHKLSGAPLGATAESDVPDYAADPDGAVTPLDAHIRLANPRTAATDSSLILRRGFSYSRGFDRAGQLDQGLAFVSYQRSLELGFLAVQARLTGEPLEEYIRPEGGGFFFALPGVTEPSAHLGQDLLG